MKIRAGFVSNSSSSSFCIVGFKIKEEDLEKYQHLSQEYDHENGEYIVGESVANIDEYGFEEIPFEEFVKCYTKVKAKCPDKDIKVYCGAISS